METVFINKLLNGDYDKDFGIINEDIRYEAIINFLLTNNLINRSFTFINT